MTSYFTGKETAPGTSSRGFELGLCSWAAWAMMAGI